MESFKKFYESKQKHSKEEAGYVGHTVKGQRCDQCTMWRAPNKCSAVAGDIKPEAWCEWWKQSHRKDLVKESRSFIDWDKNYGKTFKLVHTPEGQQSRGAQWSPDLVSVVTPENGNAWKTWKEVPSNILANWKTSWNNIQHSLGQHKYDQIIRSQKALQVEKSIHDPVRPGILKRQTKGKMTCSKARGLKSKQKNKGNHTAKAAQRYLNYHC